MSALINRVPTGRIISLLAELKYLNWRFKESSFTLQEMKLDPTLEKTQLDFFPLAVESKRYGRYNGKYDPYLENPLDKAGFHLTQSTERDSQKSKAVSECFTALEGLGWLEKESENKGKISELGFKVASLKYEDTELLELLRISLLGYGPFIGLLSEAVKNQKDGVVKRDDIYIGYPETGETIEVDGNSVPISIGSQKDSVTRTKSSLIAWAMTAGFLWPENLDVPTKNIHVEAMELLKDKRPWTKFVLNFEDAIIYPKEKLFVSHPLSYKWMTKSTKALRERGQADIRNATLGIEEKVKNRRFAISYLLSLASEDKKALDYLKIIVTLEKHPDLFVINSSLFAGAMEQEINIAITAGIPFERKRGMIYPKTLCNLKVLKYGAPEKVVKLIEEIYTKIS